MFNPGTAMLCMVSSLAYIFKPENFPSSFKINTTIFSSSGFTIQYSFTPASSYNSCLSRISFLNSGRKYFNYKIWCTAATTAVYFDSSQITQNLVVLLWSLHHLFSCFLQEVLHRRVRKNLTDFLFKKAAISTSVFPEIPGVLY